MSILDQAAEIIGQAEDPIIAAAERLVKNAYRGGRRDALAEVEAIVLEKQREFFEGLDPEWGLCRRILADIKKLPRESA